MMTAIEGKKEKGKGDFDLKFNIFLGQQTLKLKIYC